VLLRRGFHVADARRNYAVGIQHIRDALLACGYDKLDKQAKALGIHRSTAWTIVRTKHKLGRLSTKTIKRILANPELPPSVRAIVQQYMVERSGKLARSIRRRHNAQSAREQKEGQVDRN
jgi:hypothetical protein